MKHDLLASEGNTASPLHDADSVPLAQGRKI